MKTRTTMFIIALALTFTANISYAQWFWNPWGYSPCASGQCHRKPTQQKENPSLDVTPPDAKIETPKEFDPESIPEWEPVEIKPFCQRVIELVNQARARYGLPALAADVKLCSGCDNHSAYMTRYGFQHAYGAGRECIAMGVRSPEAVVNMWLNSSGHRAILLGSGRIIGVGVAGSYWTLRVR